MLYFIKSRKSINNEKRLFTGYQLKNCLNIIEKQNVLGTKF